MSAVHHRTGPELVARDAAVGIRRIVNEEIAAVAIRFEPKVGETFEFFCEFGDLRCRAMVDLTLAEYRQLGAPGSVVGH